MTNGMPPDPAVEKANRFRAFKGLLLLGVGVLIYCDECAETGSFCPPGAVFFVGLCLFGAGMSLWLLLGAAPPHDTSPSIRCEAHKTHGEVAKRCAAGGLADMSKHPK